MKLHKHHNIAKSRGGPEEEWNYSYIGEYDHAYEHAVDFVLFSEAPLFDYRHPAWPLLPEDLKKAVRRESSRRRREANKRLHESGLHPMQREENRVAQSERCRSEESLVRLARARESRTSEGLAKGGKATGPANGKAAMAQKWRCKVTGKITNAAALSRWQMARNIDHTDPSNRERLS